MTPHESWFVDYKKQDFGQVLLGNNKACKVVGVGTVSILMADGCQRKLFNVRHVPELKRNLISLGTLDSEGFQFKAENGCLKILKGSMVFMKGNRVNGLYLLQGKIVIGVSQ